MARASDYGGDVSQSRHRRVRAGPHRAGNLVDGWRQPPHVSAGRLPQAHHARGRCTEMIRTRMKRQAGVTLMELTIAVTLLSLLSVGLLFAFRIGLTASS